MKKEEILFKAQNESYDERATFIESFAWKNGMAVGFALSILFFLIKLSKGENFYDSYIVVFSILGIRELSLLYSTKEKKHYIGIAILLGVIASLVKYFLG